MVALEAALPYGPHSAASTRETLCQPPGRPLAALTTASRHFETCRCMPQKTESRRLTKEEEKGFKLMLGNMNLLYLAMRVMILYDRDYNTRFWCLAESYLAMQMASDVGLEPAWVNGQLYNNRCVVRDTSSEQNLGFDTLAAQWLKVKGLTLAKALGQITKDPSVKVTNQGDKDILQMKLLAFEEKVKKEASELGLKSQLILAKNLQKETELAKKEKEIAEKKRRAKRQGGQVNVEQEARRDEQRLHREKVQQQAAERARADAKLKAQLTPMKNELREAKAEKMELEAFVKALEEEIRKLGGDPSMARNRHRVAPSRKAAPEHRPAPPLPPASAGGRKSATVAPAPR